jgi:hypothetical protein
MSYIRCLSNPEGLYAYGTAEDTVQVYIGGEYTSATEPCFEFPARSLWAAMVAFDDTYDEPVCVDGISISEDKEFRILIEYKGEWMRLWRVTYMYFAKHAKARLASYVEKESTSEVKE